MTAWLIWVNVRTISRPIGIAKTLVVYHPEIYFIEVRTINVQTSVLFFFANPYNPIFLFVWPIGKVAPMIDYNRKSFIYMQRIDDRMEFLESIIIGKILKQKNLFFI